MMEWYNVPTSKYALKAIILSLTTTTCTYYIASAERKTRALFWSVSIDKLSYHHIGRKKKSMLAVWTLGVSGFRLKLDRDIDAILPKHIFKLEWYHYCRTAGHHSRLTIASIERAITTWVAICIEYNVINPQKWCILTSGILEQDPYRYYLHCPHGIYA